MYSVGSTKFAKKNIKVLTLFLTSKGLEDKHKVDTRFDSHSKTSMFLKLGNADSLIGDETEEDRLEKTVSSNLNCHNSNSLGLANLTHISSQSNRC